MPETRNPSVFVEEIPSGARPMIHVSTSVTAFVGYLKRGPLNSARRVLGMGDFEGIYGRLDADCEVSYAVKQFFLNGGTEALIVRVAADDPATGSGLEPGIASVTMHNEAGQPVLCARAESPGEWGNLLQIDVDYDQVNSAGAFNLKVTQSSPQGGILVTTAVESYRNLSMNPALAGYAVTDVNSASGLIRLEEPPAVTHNDMTSPPAQTGTSSTSGISAVNKNNLDDTINVIVAGNDSNPLSASFNLATGAFTTSSQLRSMLQSALRTVSGLQQATVQLFGDRLRIKPGVADNDAIISFSGALAETLGLAGAGVVENVQAYSLGAGAEHGHQSGVVKGSDGLLPGASELIGSRQGNTGMFALEDVDLFNTLCIPRMASLNTAEATQLITEASIYCEKRNAFLIVDIPEAVNTASEMQDWITENAGLRHKNTAVYFPRIMVADPLDEYQLKARPVSGTLAGIYARIDNSRGVWKAPAGVQANLVGVQALEYNLSHAENGVLNLLGVNALRTLTGFGHLSWGARTLDGGSQRASEWKYIPVRRTALFIEESLLRGTLWVVFEPNDEPLWAQIRLNVGAFMNDLFQRGAFRGASASNAYFVKCDRETTTQADIDRGIVNIMVGFAPLKPAEFVVLTIQQAAGQLA